MDIFQDCARYLSIDDLPSLALVNTRSMFDVLYSLKHRFFLPTEYSKADFINEDFYSKIPSYGLSIYHLTKFLKARKIGGIREFPRYARYDDDFNDWEDDDIPLFNYKKVAKMIASGSDIFHNEFILLPLSRSKEIGFDIPKLLIKNGVDVNGGIDLNNLDNIPGSIGIGMEDDFKCKNVEFLIENGLDLHNVVILDGEEYQDEYEPLIKMAIKHGVIFNWEGDKAILAEYLDYHPFNNEIDFIEDLIYAGGINAYSNQFEDDISTPLGKSTQNPKLVKFLLDRGAISYFGGQYNDPELINAIGITPLSYFSVKTFLEYGFSPIFYPMSSPDEDGVFKPHSNNDYDDYNDVIYIPLIQLMGMTNILQFNNGQPSLEYKDSWKYMLDTLKLLLRYGADINLELDPEYIHHNRNDLVKLGGTSALKYAKILSEKRNIKEPYYIMTHPETWDVPESNLEELGLDYFYDKRVREEKLKTLNLKRET